MDHGNERREAAIVQKAQPIGLPYEKFRPSNDGLAVVFKDNLCGLINMEGEEVVPVRFASYSSEGMYIFKNGAEELRYERPEEFATENQRRLAVKKEKYLLPGFKIIGGGLNGLSNKKGEIVVPALYKFASAHKDGYIVASFDSKTWGVIDVKHNTLYPFTASKMGDWTKNRLLPVRSDKQWALLQFPSGEEVIPFGAYEYIEVYDPDKEIFKAKREGKTGLINARQEIILPFDFTYISQSDHYVQELACGNNKRAYWNSRIGYISECMFDKIQNLKDSLIIVKKDTLWAVIDAKNAKEIIPFSPFEIEKKEEYFHSKKKYNFKMQQTAKGKLNGLYDRKGKLVFPHDSVDIHVFPDLTFFIMPDYLKSSTECEHRAADGKILRTLPKEGVEVRDRYWIFNSKNPEGKYQATNFSYLDKPGHENYYSMVGKLNENLRMVKKGVYFGLTDNEGKVIIQPVFEAAEPSKDGYIRVKYEGKWGVLQNPLFDYFE